MTEDFDFLAAILKPSLESFMLLKGVSRSSNDACAEFWVGPECWCMGRVVNPTLNGDEGPEQ